MCGICGVVRTFEQPGDLALVGRMAKTLENRGPDACRAVTSGDGTAVFGMTTLAIVSPGHGYGPMVDRATGVMLTYNGEIYGFRKIAKRLSIPLTSHDTDATFVLGAFQQLGIDFLAEIDGMYAMAIHDPQESVTYLVRDRIGQKPLYFRCNGTALFFASEIKAIAEIASVSVELPPSFVTVEVPLGNPSTPYAGVDLLAPGSVLRYDHRSGLITTWSGWDVTTFAQGEADREAGPGEWVDRYAAALAASRDTHRHPDQALLLSGGVDSGVLAYLLKPTVCFTVRYPGYPDLDESERAARICRDIGSELVVVEPSAEDFRRTLPDIVRAMDHPVGNASVLSEYLCYEAIARAGVRVVSAGIGPDEYLLGYARHLLALLGPSEVREAYFASYRLLADRLWDLKGDAGVRDRYLRLVLRGPDEDGAVRSLVERMFARPGVRPDQAITLVDQELSLPALLLTSDKLSSAFGLERRSPYLTEDLVRTSFTAPPSLRVEGTTRTKALLRLAAMRLGVPNWVVDTTNKQGFSSPAPRWLVDELGTWCEEELNRALACQPCPILATLLRRGLDADPSRTYDRTRMMALMWALWWRQVNSHDVRAKVDAPAA